jgi:hypothetical protein
MMSTFEIDPHIGVGPFRFGMTESDVIATGLLPKNKTRNRRGEPNWIYDGYSVRFGAKDGLLCDVGFSKQCRVLLRGIDVFADSDALGKILSQAPNVFEFYGFLVFPDLGITLTGFHDGNESDKALTAFVRGHWDEFQKNPKFRKWG